MQESFEIHLAGKYVSKNHLPSHSFFPFLVKVGIHMGTVRNSCFDKKNCASIVKPCQFVVQSMSFCSTVFDCVAQYLNCKMLLQSESIMYVFRTNCSAKMNHSLALTESCKAQYVKKHTD